MSSVGQFWFGEYAKSVLMSNERTVLCPTVQWSCGLIHPLPPIPLVKVPLWVWKLYSIGQFEIFLYPWFWNRHAKCWKNTRVSNGFSKGWPFLPQSRCHTVVLCSADNFLFFACISSHFSENKTTRRMRYSRLNRMDKLDLMHRTDSKVATHGITLRILIKVPNF